MKLSTCDMAGHATTREKHELLLRLSLLSVEERRHEKFVLLVNGKFLDGQEAYKYLIGGKQ